VASQLPEGGHAAFAAGKWTDFQLIGQGATAIYSSTVVEGQPFDWAVRVQVPARTPNGWDVQILYPGQEPDAPWCKAAAERIDKYRKSDLTVRVVDRDGKPVRGAKVHVQMQRHAFGFGTFLEYDVMTSAGPDADKLREWTLKLFNRCTTPIYWAAHTLNLEQAAT
jgi:hypothetical protein